MISVELLKEHELNKEFFDDIEGEQWQYFIESIKTSGILTPLIVTEDYTVVSGAQRLRAAKELGLKEVPCIVKKYEDKDGLTKEEWIIKELLEVNYRQRGIANLNPIKAAKGFMELERIYQKYRGEKNQPVYEALQIPKTSYFRLKRLNKLIPPIQQLVQDGKLTQAVAYEIAYLEPAIQELLYKALKEDITEISKQEIEVIKEKAEKDVQELVEQLNALERENRKKDLEIQQKEDKIKEFESLIKQYKTALEITNDEIKKLQNQTVKEVRVVPDSIKQELENLKKQREEMQLKLESMTKELEKVIQEYEKIKEEKETYQKLLFEKEKEDSEAAKKVKRLMSLMTELNSELISFNFKNEGLKLSEFEGLKSLARQLISKLKNIIKEE
ncbi:ParB/RepB/Spo0J family partition protein [Thermoanaerobacter sp. RKWS2]|uniref:ParB/RepB/Spo0J family partition protein n=1 Tax=Thermoanaerobacter sp. RKWS2 TaxID=2983842 RepID=UPI00224A784B|nr:ParB N-terminal domain-containing protein [Thermoanaerobacter sp. RKWS2]UZQ81781.1 ParB N-terminal domain-containing protein [Thermoanaerobacter sp. RKWS2]